MMLPNEILDEIYEWLDTNNEEQCQWINLFLTRKGLRVTFFDIATPANIFDSQRYNWPSGDELTDLIATMRDDWLLNKEIDWVVPSDATQAHWLDEKLNTIGIRKISNSGNDFDIAAYDWTSDKVRSKTMRKLRDDWRTGGFDLSWIKSENLYQLEWLDRCMEENNRKYNMKQKYAIPFNPNQYNWGYNSDKIQLITNLINHWRLQKKFTWIKQDNAEQCGWAHNFLKWENIQAPNGVHSTIFLAYEYDWPQSKNQSNQLIKKMKEEWVFMNATRWIDHSDKYLSAWVKEYLSKYSSTISTVPLPREIDYKTNHITCPENVDKINLIKEMHTGWSNSGYSFDWIDQKNTEQCERANKYLQSKLPQNTGNITLSTKPFDIGRFNWPNTVDRKSLISKMQKAMTKHEQRAKSGKAILSFEINNDTKKTLTTLSKSLKKSRTATIEQLINDGLKYEKRASDKYQKKLDESKIYEDLSNPKYLPSSAKDKMITGLGKRIKTIEKKHNELIEAVKLILKQNCENNVRISVNDLRGFTLDMEQQKFADELYEKLHKKYLIPLPE